MEFEEVIIGLYSDDHCQICDVLNQGKHVKDLGIEDLQNALHTGFYFKTHKGTLFEVLYIIPTQEVCFQKPTSILKLGLGIPMCCFGSYYEFDCDLKGKWYGSYDIQTGYFQLVSIKKFERDEQFFIDKIIFPDGREEISFTMIGTDMQPYYQYYPLRPIDIPQLFRGRNGFEPMNSYAKNNGEIKPRSYGKYRGHYVQDVEGYDDDFIDDVLDGHPDAYWNID